jgi:hypothetical protein
MSLIGMYGQYGGVSRSFKFELSLTQFWCLFLNFLMIMKGGFCTNELVIVF